MKVFGMRDCLNHYINGRWVSSHSSQITKIINPATEEASGHVALGDEQDVDLAVAAAQKAFLEYSNFSLIQKIDILEKILDGIMIRYDELAEAISLEMGAPKWLAHQYQAKRGQLHFETAIEVLKSYQFDKISSSTQIFKEPIGVCGLITPWNWPLNQIACKVAPALATGCTVVLKPSEIAPYSAQIFAEIIDAAGLPAGVFNMVFGGANVGAALSAHPDVRMISFTGSTAAGVDVAKKASESVKRVCQELGGKSANIIFEDADIRLAVSKGLTALMTNSGQSCNAPSRMLAPLHKRLEIIDAVCAAMDEITVGAPQSDKKIGPVVSKKQWETIQLYIKKGVSEGAHLIAGGLGRPEEFSQGYYIRPTVFVDVTNDMTIAREEIFGPVLSIIFYRSLEEAITIANDSVYGLAAYLCGRDQEALLKVAKRLQAGQVNINFSAIDPFAPFGGYKKSGNGREWGAYGFEEYLETKAILGYES